MYELKLLVRRASGLGYYACCVMNKRVELNRKRKSLRNKASETVVLQLLLVFFLQVSVNLKQLDKTPLNV